MTLTVLPCPEPLPLPDQVAYARLGSGLVYWATPLRWLDLDGAKATEALNGLITNDVSTLADGASMRAAALTPKGKVLADLRVVRQSATRFALILDPESAEAFGAMAKKYVNPRLATLRDITATYACWWVVGAAVSTLGPLPSGAAVVLRDLMGGYPAVLLCAPMAEHAPVSAWLSEVGTPGSETLGELLRVEGGQPAFGIDMDDTTIPQEANLDALGAISFTKGCYTGQETVARVHFRGHVNRHLRGLRASVAIPGGAPVHDRDGKLIGDVRSTVLSPTWGAIAMGMIRREVAVGATVSVETPDGTAIEAVVTTLPFSG